MDRTYVTENNRERARLRALVDRLSDRELAQPLEAGWTIAAVLAHLAFWDQRVLELIERWERDGPHTMPRPLDEKDVDWINDSTKTLCLALPPRAAARLAVSTADAADRRVEALSPQHLAANAAGGNPINLLRAEHRRAHLDEIERAVGRSGAP
jgi:uncharacterized damage-inducible protein DinB